ncbi:E3 ubiquitin-protein ligase MYLIP-like [Apostichopus japonicus]|uniref:E3 ubiquitin-protein ligase MYLIP-like n=1 Tax=Stichopus japonicus TaxID=307972 RepID=UPI003AB77142
MWCFVSECPLVVREYHIPKKSRGQLLLDRVCDDLGLVERDYFGLRYRSKNGELLWLNLRNTLGHQLHGKSPHRLSIQVKFFVSPAELQQSITRNLFYLTIKNRFLLSQYMVSDEEKHHLLSLICQAELGPAEHVLFNQYHPILPELEEDELKTVQTAHRNLTLAHNNPVFAQVQFVAQVAELPGYGVEYFAAETIDKTSVVIGVCSTGLQILTQERVLIHSINYEDISKVSYHQNRFSVHYYKSTAGTGQEELITALKFRLNARKVAQALFRAFTECHTFFRCENVERIVRQQHSHIGFGAFIVLFRPDTDKGKTYRFDVSRTRRQAYDCAWRRLHPTSCPPHGENRTSMEIELARDLAEPSDFSLLIHSTYSQELQLSRESYHTGDIRLQRMKAQITEDEMSDEDSVTNVDITGATPSDRQRQDSKCSLDKEFVTSMQEQLSNLRESRLCQVCLETEMATVFCPCGHMICCETCSKECFRCPICRAEVTYVQRVFFG